MITKLVAVDLTSVGYKNVPIDLTSFGYQNELRATIREAIDVVESDFRYF